MPTIDMLGDVLANGGAVTAAHLVNDMHDSEATILSPVSADDPCGPNLEYDAAFATLERAMLGKPEHQIGETIVPGEAPNWKEVQIQATALLQRSKDLRAATGLALALLHDGGLSGFARGLGAVHGLIEQYWEGLHPRLDPEDGHDPTMRVNVLLELATPSVLTTIRTAPMVSARAIGRFSLKDWEIASGDAPVPAGTEPATQATINAALMECDLSELEGTASAARACAAALTQIAALVALRVNAEHAPDLGKPVALLQKIATLLGMALARRQPVVATNEDGSISDSGGRMNGIGHGISLTGEITSREDVIRALDKICAYYARFEPSSPVPMFMERCKRLVSKSFIDIVRDLVPDAVSHIEVLKGPE